MKTIVDEVTAERIAVSCHFSLDVVTNQNNREGDRHDQGQHLNQAIERPLWMTIRDFLSANDVLGMRTAAQKWHVARLHGPEAELFFLLRAKDDRRNRASRPEWPELQPGCRQLFEAVRNSLIQVRDNGARRHAFLREFARS